MNHLCAGYAALPHTPPQRCAHMGAPLRNAAIPRDTPRLLFLGHGYAALPHTPCERLSTELALGRVTTRPYSSRTPAIPLEYAGDCGMMQNKIPWSFSWIWG